VHPDGIAPGKCVDRSNVPASLTPGAGAQCEENALGTMSSEEEAGEICAAAKADPDAPYPAACANFDQLGVRVPFIAVSPFSKRSYVSHAVSDHTSILKFIETAFLPRHQHLTARDRAASDLLDLFDFVREPSRHTPVGIAAPPAADCTPDHQDVAVRAARR
jgi:phospholipase C